MSKIPNIKEYIEDYFDIENFLLKDRQYTEISQIYKDGSIVTAYFGPDHLLESISYSHKDYEQK